MVAWEKAFGVHSITQRSGACVYPGSLGGRVLQRVSWWLLGWLLGVTFAITAIGQERPHGSAPPAAQPPPAAAESVKPEAKPAEEKPVVTHHKITAGGKTLAYTATTGRMAIKNDQGVMEAQMFYVAYTLDSSGAKRPLTFAFNGGPGAATIWLHMGCFGPKRVKMQPNGFMPHPPFELEDNQSTI